MKLCFFNCFTILFYSKPTNGEAFGISFGFFIFSYSAVPMLTITNNVIFHSTFIYSTYASSFFFLRCNLVILGSDLDLNGSGKQIRTDMFLNFQDSVSK